MKSVARVIINSPVKNLDRLFDYNIPAFLADKVACGVRVEVPFGFGNRKKEAYVLELADETSAQNTKDIIRVLDAAPLVDGFGLELIEFIRDTYFCTYNEAIKLLVPPGTGMKYEEYATLIQRDDADELVKNSMNQEAVLNALRASGGVLSLAALQSQAGHNVRSTLRALEKKGLVQIGHVARQAVREKTVTLVSICCEEDPADLCDELAQRAPKQAEIIDFLAGCDRISVADLCMVLNCSKPSVDALVKKGYLCYETEKVRRNPFSQKDVPQTEKMSPTPEQAAALSKILESAALQENKTFLIHGVTGSGKTEVFLQTISAVLERGKTAIVLVPEISLTPQMTSRFLGRFQNVVAILHSALSLGERLDEWNRILSGEAKVVIGARSAIFAPLSNIGVIIVDEEHESTYQSENTPRYNALDVADFRAKQHNALLILASATPSVASYYKAKTGKFELISMQNRYNNAPLPAAEVVDMRAELAAGNRTVFSQRLREEMAVNLKKKEQTVLFLNRRGFSTFVSCRDCGYVATCPECSISLTYHRYNNTLACHYCGYRIPNYETCPACGGRHIRYFGTGTQKVEEDLHQAFPNASVIRMDVDTTQKKQSHEKILTEFSENKIDVLLGTQMVSKGLDYPGISLVGVLAADMSLNMDDYRAQERTFDLITQVCGRAGRGDVPGRAIIQTYMPEDATIGFAKNQDYIGFYEAEIAYRKLFCYPPFCDILCFVASGEDEGAVRAALIKVFQYMKALLLGEDITWYAPHPAPIYKMKSKFRYRFWLKCSFGDEVRGAVRKTLDYFYGKKLTEVNLAVSINPNSMY